MLWWLCKHWWFLWYQRRWGTIEWQLGEQVPNMTSSFRWLRGTRVNLVSLMSLDFDEFKRIIGYVIVSYFIHTVTVKHQLTNDNVHDLMMSFGSCWYQIACDAGELFTWRWPLFIKRISQYRLGIHSRKIRKWSEKQLIAFCIRPRISKVTATINPI